LRHGHVTVAGAHLTGSLVAIFAVGLPGFSIYLLLMRAYQSMKNTRSMFWCYVGENALTLVVGVALYPALGVEGLAIGWIGAYSVAALFTVVHLRHRAGGLQGPAVLATTVRVVIATAVMAVVLVALSALLPSGASLMVLAGRVILLAGVGTVVYVLAALFLGVTEVRQVLRIRRRA
jgi:putative peptidoglycan lipid II flippase